MVCFVAEVLEFFVHCFAAGRIEDAADDYVADFSCAVAAHDADCLVGSHFQWLAGCRERNRQVRAAVTLNKVV